ncbi:MAG TPA: alpha-glucosidase/alpha-galactosidase [Chthoniobacteraceae bacterium]|nr:alpha-glucosidase/alpha-galactosidase [Chthoniobacteraceae bacterium]
MLKITLVGAGSVVFSKTLIGDLLQYPALQEVTLCLMDINPERLVVIGKLARRMVSQLGLTAKVETTTDLREACRGARFVITTIQVGGYKPSTVVDFEIPARYGLQQTIADTLGVGGVFRALRSIPKLVEVARMLQEVGAPDPLLLNYTNPMAMNMWAIDKMTGLPGVGLCHSVQGTSRQIASYCGLDPREVSYRVAGINHMAFFLKFETKGKDAYPLLFRALDDPATFARDRVRFEMMRRLGYFVTESSEHQSEYVPYFIQHGEEVISRFGIPINEYIRRCEKMAGRWEQVENSLLDESKPVEIHRSVEYGSTIVNSIVSGAPSVIYGNVPNTGLITNLTQGCCVEVPCLVDRQGLQPTFIGELPAQLAGIIQTNIAVQQLTVEAARTGRRDYIYQAVMLDPHTASVLPLDKIWAMCDEMIEAHQRDGVLGEFKPVAKNTGKPLAAVERVFLSIRPEGVPFLGGEPEAKFTFVAENRTREAFEEEIALATRHLGGAATPPIAVKVAPGESVEIPFTLRRGESADEEAEPVIEIISPSLMTLERDLRLPKRLSHLLPVRNDGSEPLRFNVTWSGNLVAECSSWLTDEQWIIEARVDDTDVRVAPYFIDGSALEIGFKDPSGTLAAPTVLVALPDRDEPRVLLNPGYSGGERFEGAGVEVCIDDTGYRLRVGFDRKALGLEEARPFLTDIVFHVNALGTAHGKICKAWNDSHSQIKMDVSRFVLMVPTA